MRLNPFEDLDNEIDLRKMLTSDKYCCKIKETYMKLLKYDDEFNLVDYEPLVKSINTKIDWSILTIGEYQGDYLYFSKYLDKFYFIDIGFGSCSGCDRLMAVMDDIKALSDLREKIKASIREFDSTEELLSWVTNSCEWWLEEKDNIVKFIKARFINA